MSGMIPTFATERPSPSLTSSQDMEGAGFSGKTIKVKLSTPDVFDQLRTIICSIKSTVGESSGFFFNSRTIVTVAHNISELCDPSGSLPLQVDYGHEGHLFFLVPSRGVNLEQARVLDLYSMEIQCEILDSSIIPPLPEDFELKVGMKVYFAGYPLNQDDVTFHKGTISSITVDQGIKHFTIDGTVVPGNSGGPVVIQHDGRLYVIGVITSEVADFSPKDLETIAIIKELAERNEKKTNLGRGSVRADEGGVTTSIEILTPEGPKTININDRDQISLAFDLIQRNLSTGIGKAIDIRHYKHLFEQCPELPQRAKYSFPVGKGNKLIAGKITHKDEKKKQPISLVDYHEVRFGLGKGNRGIRCTVTAAFQQMHNLQLQEATVIYKFSPNPHTAAGNYNKNQVELYRNAADEFTNMLRSTSQLPPKFTFNACQSTYTATLEQD